MSFWSRLFHRAAGEHYQRGIRWFNEGDYDRAVEELEKVVAEDKSGGSPVGRLGAFYAAEAHGKLGIAEFHRGNLDKALRHFEEAVQVNPHHPDLYYYIGLVHHQMGDMDRAIDSLRRATELNPEYAEALCFLGLALRRAGFLEQANDCMSKALGLVRRTPTSVSRLLLDTLGSSAFSAHTVAQLKRALADNSRFKESMKQGNMAFNRGCFDEAIAAFQTAASLRPDYPDVRCRLGLAFLENGDDEEAAACFRKALEKNPRYAQAQYFLGIALYHLQRFVESRDFLERAVSLQPNYADVHCQLGIAHLALGDFEEAKAEFVRSIEISPRYARAHYMLGLVLHASGREEEASRKLTDALSLKPNLFSPHGARGPGRSHTVDSTAGPSPHAGRNPNHADALHLQASAHLDNGRLEDAQGTLEKALAINPDYLEAKKQLALVFFKKREFAAAERLIRSALDQRPRFADLHKILGDIQRMAGDLDEAVAAYKQSLVINPDYSEALQSLVATLRKSGRSEEANRVLEAYLDRNPSDAGGRALRAATRVDIKKV